MNLAQATQKVETLASNHGGKFGQKVNFKFDEGVIHLDDTVTPTSVTNEEATAPCTIKMKLENFDKLMNGDLNPMMAFMSGKMKIDGDKAIAMKLASLF
jgi:putative sterol carrier protein